MTEYGETGTRKGIHDDVRNEGVDRWPSLDELCIRSNLAFTCGVCSRVSFAPECGWMIGKLKRRWSPLDQTAQDIRSAARTLRRQPMFTALALLLPSARTVFVGNEPVLVEQMGVSRGFFEVDHGAHRAL